MANNMDINTNYRATDNLNTGNHTGVSRQKTSFKKLLFGDNNFVMPNVSIGQALKSYDTAAGRAE